MSVEFRKSINVDVDFLVDVGGARQTETKSITIVMLPATKAYKFFTKLTKEDGGLGSFTEDEIKELVLLSTSWKPEKFEITFAGNMIALMSLAAKIVDYNFEDVFTALGSDDLQAEGSL